MYPGGRESGTGFWRGLRLAPHRPLDGFLLLRGERDRGAAPFELLHVDPGVVATLDRRHDDAATGRVEERERRGLMAARVLVGVVADDRGVRHRSVDAPVDPGEARSDLVDGPMEVV